MRIKKYHITDLIKQIHLRNSISVSSSLNIISFPPDIPEDRGSQKNIKTYFSSRSNTFALAILSYQPCGKFRALLIKLNKPYRKRQTGDLDEPSNDSRSGKSVGLERGLSYPKCCG